MFRPLITILVSDFEDSTWARKSPNFSQSDDVTADIARTLMPAASSGAILARLVSCSSRALDDANRAPCVLMNYCSAKQHAFRNAEYERAVWR